MMVTCEYVYLPVVGGPTHDLSYLDGAWIDELIDALSPVIHRYVAPVPTVLKISDDLFTKAFTGSLFEVNVTLMYVVWVEYFLRIPIIHKSMNL